MEQSVIIIVLLFVLISMVFSIPLRPLRCSVDFSKKTIDCSGREMETTILLINSNEAMKIKTINFSNNNIRQIEDLDNFANVEEVDLKLNAIENVTSMTFSAQKNITKIDLSYNNIAHLDPYVFIKNKNLKSLYIRGNSLLVPAEKPIVCSASLEILDVGTCELARLTKENLLCLPSLKHLDLTSNFLITTSPAVFSPLSNLMSINLGNNCFHCDCKFTELLKWAKTMKTDMSSSESCVLPNNRGMIEFEKVEKDLNCSTLENSVVPDSQKSQNEKASSEFYDYILVSYDTGVQTSQGQISARYMGMISNKLYTIESLLSLVLFLLVIVTGMLFCRHYRTVGDIRNSVSDYSKLSEPISEFRPKN